jgi:site-specific DNA-methyltransferase (adenine-specific)
VIRITDKIPKGLRFNQQNVHDGLDMIRYLPDKSVKIVFFDPQHRPLLDRMGYGNETKTKMIERGRLPQMSTSLVLDFLQEIARVLRPSGYLMLWVDKFALVQGSFLHVDLPAVDMITWEKSRIGMGYRSRRKSDYLLVMQRPPLKARATWRTMPMVPDVWSKEAESRTKITHPSPGHTVLIDKMIRHPHAKPEGLQRLIIEATTRRGDVVVDPSAGGYSVMRSALACGRNFLGCDLRTWRQM